jgi:hypothetical protein
MAMAVVHKACEATCGDILLVDRISYLGQQIYLLVLPCGGIGGDVIV